MQLNINVITDSSDMSTWSLVKELTYSLTIFNNLFYISRC